MHLAYKVGFRIRFRIMAQCLNADVMSSLLPYDNVQSGDEESEEKSEEEEEEAMPVPALTKDCKKNLKPIPPIKLICKPVKRMPTIHRSSTIIGLGSPAASESDLSTQMDIYIDCTYIQEK